MNNAYVTAAAIGLASGGGVSSIAAFSTPSSSLSAVRCDRASIISSSSRVSIQSPLVQHAPSTSVLFSSLEESPGVEASSNETLSNIHDIIHIIEEGINQHAESATTNAVNIDDDSPQKQLQQVLSSPELLDPASILDATIGITGDDGSVTVESLASEAQKPIVTDVTDEGGSVTSPQAAGAKSKDEDLELTLQAILDHMEEISSLPDGGIVEMDEDEDEILRQEMMIKSDMSDQAFELKEFDTMMTSDMRSNQLEQQSQNKSILDNTPSVRKILRYTIPAIGIWLCSPVLSMIDTASVGLLSGTAQQAALNPAISISDYTALLVAFMYTATTNLIAAAVREDKDGVASDAQPRTVTTLITALKLALAVGTVFGVLLGVGGNALLKILIGNDAIDPAVFTAALRYVKIRALGMPATVSIGAAQSACLGMQDVKSPLYVLAAAAGVNFLGDVLLVPHSSAIFGGAAGAAWATTASQYAALIFFWRWLTTKAEKSDASNDSSSDNDSAHVVNVTKGIMELTGSSKSGKSRRKELSKYLSSSKLSRRIHRASKKFHALGSIEAGGTSSTTAIVNTGVEAKKKIPKSRGFLAGKLTLRNYLSLSNLNKSVARKFLPFVIPVTTTSVGRISGYIAMSHVASSTLGTQDMAAHQILFSIFCCLAPFVDALNQVAQSFVPSVFEAKEKNNEWAMALRRTTKNFRKVGAGFGAILVALASCIPLISRYFTTDPIVLQKVNGAIPGVGLFLLVNGLMCAGEGALLGQLDLKFLRNAYTLFFFAVPAYMLRLKYRALAGVEVVSVATMWTAFSVYNVIRTSFWHLRLSQLQRRNEKIAEAR